MQSIWVWLVLAVIVVGGVFWWLQSSSAPANTPTATTSVDTGASSSATDGSTTTMTSAATVTFDGTQFSPSTVTVKQGESVTFTSTGQNMWIASNPHPIHNAYDGTTLQQHCATGYAGPEPFDQCSPGTSFTFTFDKVGTWGYHDHLTHQATGTIIVTP